MAASEGRAGSCLPTSRVVTSSRQAGACPTITSQQLALELLAHSIASPEQNRIAAAFELFLERHSAGDVLATQVAKQIAKHMHAADGRPYFLEQLQRAADGLARRKRGVFFTPYPVVQHLTQAALAVFADTPCTIIDPACGAGMFLTAAISNQHHENSNFLGFDICPASVQVAQRLVPTVNFQCVNPLIAGEELAVEMLVPNQPLIVLGNPPYANYGRLNQSPWLKKLLADYRVGLNERKSNLGDDFIKFIRWGQYWIDRAGRGVLAFVTSRTYLDGLTHRAMRQSLLTTFDQISIVDLHGDQATGDENLFAIRRGVCLALMVKHAVKAEKTTSVNYVEVRGSRAKKLQALSVSLSYQSVEPRSPHYSLLPLFRTTAATNPDYHTWPSLAEIFREYVSGVQTKNDALFVDHDRDKLAERMQRALAGEIEVRWPRELVELPAYDEAFLQRYLVAPGDERWIYYEPGLLGRARYATLRHLQQSNNVALIFMRQTAGVNGFSHAWATKCLASDRVFYSRRGAPFLAPLWLHDGTTLEANFHPLWLDKLQNIVQRPCPPREVLAYLYGGLHTPRYRQRYAMELASDFPRIPWPESHEQFQSVAQIGEQLLQLHTQQLCSTVTLRWHGDGSISRGYPRYEQGKCWLNSGSWIEGIEPAAWQFEVGGYVVLKQWLKARQGRSLTSNEWNHVQGLHAMLQETLAIIAKCNDSF